MIFGNILSMIDLPDPDSLNQTPDSEGYVDFGDLARSCLNMQCQYASRYVNGKAGAENCGNGLRFKGDSGEYHSLRIHKDDAREFIERVKLARPSTFSE